MLHIPIRRWSISELIISFFESIPFPSYINLTVLTKGVLLSVLYFIYLHVAWKKSIPWMCCFTNYTYFCFWQCPVMIWVIPLFVYIAIHIAQLAWRLLFVIFRGICNVRGQGHCSIVFDNFSVRKVRWLILASWIFFFTLLRINIELLLLLLSNLSIMVTFTTNICVLNRQWFEWHKVKFANI